MREDDGPVRAAASPPAEGAPEVPAIGDRRGAFSGGLWNAASAVLPMGSALLLSIVISRHLGAAALGRQSFIAYVSSTLVSVLIFAFTSASVQVLASAVGAGDDDKRAWVSRWAHGAHLTGGTACVLAMVVIGLLSPGRRVLWLLAAATALTDAVGWSYASLDIARRGWAPTASRRLVAQALSPLGGIVAVYAGAGVTGVFVAQLLVSLVLTAELRRIDSRAPHLSREGRPAPPWRPVMAVWGFLALSTLIAQVVDRRLELVFLDRYQDSHAVAMYSVAFSIVTIATTVCGVLIGSASPAIAARWAAEPDAVRGVLGQVVRVLVVLELVLLAGTAAVAAHLVTAVYGAGFAEAGTLVRWLAISLLVSPLTHLYTAFLTGMGDLRPVVVAGATAAVVDVALAWSLVPFLSTSGAVVASVGAQLVNCLMIIGAARRRGLTVQLRARRLARSTGLVALAAAAAVAVGVLLPGLPGQLLAAVAFGAVLAAGARWLGLFAHDDGAWLSSTVPGPVGRLLVLFSPPARAR